MLRLEPDSCLKPSRLETIKRRAGHADQEPYPADSGLSEAWDTVLRHLDPARPWPRLAGDRRPPRRLDREPGAGPADRDRIPRLSHLGPAGLPDRPRLRHGA